MGVEDILAALGLALTPAWAPRNFLRFFLSAADAARIVPGSLQVSEGPLDGPAAMDVSFTVADPQAGAPQLRPLFPGSLAFVADPADRSAVVVTVDFDDAVDAAAVARSLRRTVSRPAPGGARASARQVSTTAARSPGSAAHAGCSHRSSKPARSRTAWRSRTASPAGSARKTLSTGGSENTVFTALSKSSGAIFSTS